MYYKIIRIKVGSIMKFQKVYIVLAALVLALGTAVYVNWQFGGGKTDTSAKELGAASYVNATVSSATEDENVQTAKNRRVTLQMNAQSGSLSRMKLSTKQMRF